MSELWCNRQGGNIDHPIDGDYLNVGEEDDEPVSIAVEYRSLPKGFHQVVRERWEREKESEQSEPHATEISVSEEHNETTEWRDGDDTFEFGGTDDDSMRTTLYAKEADDESKYNRLWKYQFGKGVSTEIDSYEDLRGVDWSAINVYRTKPSYAQILEDAPELHSTDWKVPVYKFKLTATRNNKELKRGQRAYVDSLIDVLDVSQNVRKEIRDTILSEPSNYVNVWNRWHSGFYGRLVGYCGALLNVDTDDLSRLSSLIDELRQMNDFDVSELEVRESDDPEIDEPDMEQLESDLEVTDSFEMSNDEISSAVEYGYKRLEERNMTPIY